jgi:hypothetical protein
MEEIDKRLLHEISGGFYEPLIWGSILGSIGYTVSNKYNFNISGLVIAALGGGLTGCLEPFGALGKVLQVANVALTSEVVSYIQTGEL